MNTSLWLILALIGILILYFFIIWLFLKSAIKSGTKEAIMETLFELDIIEYKSHNNTNDS